MIYLSPRLHLQHKSIPDILIHLSMKPYLLYQLSLLLFNLITLLLSLVIHLCPKFEPSKILIFQLKTDERVNKNTSNTSYLILEVFVDDILCLGTDPGIINWFKEQLSSHFTITIKSSVDSFFGMQLSHKLSSRTISRLYRKFNDAFWF